MDSKCKKLGNRATQREIKEAHRAKQELKQALRGSTEERKPYVLANQSNSHEKYGETPQQQAARMLEKSS